VRYPDGTEIMPQVELRFIFDFAAGIKPREFGGPDGTAAVAKAVLAALD
jgi:hypothetical protein